VLAEGRRHPLSRFCLQPVEHLRDLRRDLERLQPVLAEGIGQPQGVQQHRQRQQGPTIERARASPECEPEREPRLQVLQEQRQPPSRQGQEQGHRQATSHTEVPETLDKSREQGFQGTQQGRAGAEVNQRDGQQQPVELPTFGARRQDQRRQRQQHGNPADVIRVKVRIGQTSQRGSSVEVHGTDHQIERQVFQRLDGDEIRINVFAKIRQEMEQRRPENAAQQHGQAQGEDEALAQPTARAVRVENVKGKSGEHPHEQGQLHVRLAGKQGQGQGDPQEQR